MKQLPSLEECPIIIPSTRQPKELPMILVLIVCIVTGWVIGRPIANALVQLF